MTEDPQSDQLSKGPALGGSEPGEYRAESTPRSFRQFTARLARRGVALLVIALTALLPFQDSSHIEMVPGPVYPIEFSDEEVANDDAGGAAGSWSFTTVAVRQLSYLELLLAKLKDNTDVFPTTGSPSRSTSAAEMQTAKLAAAAAADNILYYSISPTEWMVLEVQKSSLADERNIVPGDRISLVNDIPIASPETFSSLLSAGPTTFTIIDSYGSERKVAFDQTTPGEKLGVRLAPVVISERVDGRRLKSADVGGGSAGLMFTLALTDLYSDGDLTGGLSIAGTGTVTPKGEVGAVLGTGYKYRAAVAAGADIFFVPRGSKEDLPSGGPVKIVEVDTAADAVRWLCGRTSTPVPLCARLRG